MSGGGIKRTGHESRGRGGWTQHTRGVRNQPAWRPGLQKAHKRNPPTTPDAPNCRDECEKDACSWWWRAATATHAPPAATRRVYLPHTPPSRHCYDSRATRGRTGALTLLALVRAPGGERLLIIRLLAWRDRHRLEHVFTHFRTTSRARRNGRTRRQRWRGCVGRGGRQSPACPARRS